MIDCIGGCIGGGSESCGGVPFCRDCTNAVEALERLLNEAEDRGREENERKGNA